MIKKIFFTFFIAVLLCKTIYPKNLTLKTGFTSNVNRESIHNYWNSKTGGELALSVPLLNGSTSAGMSFNQYESTTEDIPDYKCFLFYLNWSFRFNLITDFSFYPGIEIGNYQVLFDDDSVVEQLQTERELYLGISSELVYYLTEKFSIYGMVRHFRVYTNKKIDLTYVSTGLKYDFKMPGFISSFLYD